jgi:tRNA nucleotidyltransferase (CCA-adding enzyme)
MLDAAACDAAGRGGPTINTATLAPPRAALTEWPPRTTWLAAMHAVRAVDGGEIARACRDKQHIAQAIHAARVAAVRTLSKDEHTGSQT